MSHTAFGMKMQSCGIAHLFTANGTPQSKSATSFLISYDSFEATDEKDCVLFKLAGLVSNVFTALQSDNGQKKASNNNNSATKLSSADSKNLEYKNLYQEFSKLKKILDIIKG